MDILNTLRDWQQLNWMGIATVGWLVGGLFALTGLVGAVRILRGNGR